jgi:hypothetical protein
MSRDLPKFFRAHESSYKYSNSLVPTSTVTSTIEKIEYSETEGFQVWYTGSKYPTYGLFDPYAQGAADPVKRYLRNELRLTSKYPLRALAFLSKKFRKDWLEEYAAFCYMNLRPFVYKDEHWCRAVKELNTALARLPEFIRDAVCVILEQDRPYRYRLQDVLSCLDKNALEKNPKKEIRRLLALLAKRDKQVNWGKIPKLISLALNIPFVLWEIVFVLRRIDPVTMGLDTADLYNCLINGCEQGNNRYHFLGLDNEGMTKLHMTL